MGLKDQILESRDYEETLVEIPEWDNAKIACRGLGSDMQGWLFEQALGKDENALLLTLMANGPKILIDAVYDPETGERIFTDEDKESLKKKNGRIIRELVLMIIENSGITEKAVAEAKKNSSETPDSKDISGSP